MTEHLAYNPATDRYETGGDEIEFAEEGEDEPDLTTQVAELIADTFGRSTIDADFELAEQIIHLVRS